MKVIARIRNPFIRTRIKYKDWASFASFWDSRVEIKFLDGKPLSTFDPYEGKLMTAKEHKYIGEKWIYLLVAKGCAYIRYPGDDDTGSDFEGLIISQEEMFLLFENNDVLFDNVYNREYLNEEFGEKRVENGTSTRECD